jgi:hypothetical protein
MHGTVAANEQGWHTGNLMTTEKYSCINMHDSTWSCFFSCHSSVPTL